MQDELYFDCNGSTPVDERVLEATLPWLRDGCANAAAAHPEGRRAARAIAGAREQIAAALGCLADEIYFTSGGTEANNWALQGSARVARRGHVVASAIEHKSVLSTVRELERQGFEATLVAPRADGAVRVEDVAAALRPDTFLVALMAANNETGSIQPVAAVGALCRERGVRFHVDAVAALGKLDLDVRELCCDLLSLSSHKLYAPKGCGTLFVKSGTELAPLIHGCGQQGGLRGGSENTPGAVAFGRALELSRQGELGSRTGIGELRDELWKGIAARFPRAERNGTAACLSNTLNVHFPGASAGVLVQELGARGFSVSAGAAGAEGATSHVLEAMGLSSARARSSLRFSLGARSTPAGVRALLEALEACSVLSEKSLSR